MKLRETKLREFTFKQKLLSGSLLTSYLSLVFFPVSLLFSQNVNYPNFVAPQLQQQQNLNQYTSIANQSTSLYSWQAITGQGLAEIKSNWENAAVLEIESTVSSITTSPNPSMTLQQYQNAVSAYLWAQENNAETQWLNQIDSQLSTARDNFINGQLAFNISHSTVQNQSLSIVESKNQVAPTSEDYRTALNTGLQKFSDSLTDLQRNYQQQLSSLNQTDAQYQANLQQLQNYENAVRQNMQTAVTSLENSLKTTSLFYNTNPDGTTNWNSMTQAGTDLQALITSLDQGFANGTPVSALANQMVSYLHTQELQAQTNANYWAQQATPYNAPALSGLSFGTSRQIYGGSDLVAYGDSIASQNPIIGAIKAYIDGGSNPQDSTLINYLYSNYFNSSNVKILGINSADFYGFNENYNPFPVTLWHSGDNLYYSNSGYNAFDFTATGLWAFGIFLPITQTFSEDKFQYSINVQVQDLNAQANANAWNGFVSNLTTELSSWNTITPSIANLENQVSAYQAQYAAWHAQEVVYKDSLQQSFTTGVQSLTNQQQSWENNLKNSFQSIASSGEKSDDSDRSRNLDSLSPKIVFNSLPVDSKLLSSDTTAPVIDQGSLNNTLSIFQQSLMGASNLALENQLNKQAIEEKSNAVNRIASSLGSNAVVDSHGNIVYTTAIEDGHARLKAGGDATNSSDYEATKVNESVYLSAPATIKIAAAGNLFQTWDTNSVISANQANENSFTSSYNSTVNSLNAQIAALNSLNAKNDASFQEEAKAAASYASDVQSLAKAMLQGGTFESWAKGQIQDKVNAAMATAIASATGMSPDMASQLVSWFEKNQAEKKAKAKARTQAIVSGAEVVASIALSFVAGPEMLALGQAAIQAVQGYQSGGIEGALVGAASGAVSAYTREVGFNANVSYSRDGGFAAGVSFGSSAANVGVSFSQHGSTSFNAGGKYGNISYNPSSGFSGSVNLTPNAKSGGVMINVGQHSGPSVTFQANNLKKGVGAAATISGNGNIDASATYKNANVASISGNLHDPSSFGNFTVNDQFQQQVNQNAAMEKADANLEAGKAKLEQGRNAIAASGNDYQREVLRNENTSAQDKHDVLVTIGKSNELTMDPSSASTWLGRTTQDVVGSFLGSTGLGASDSNGFIDKNGEYVQRSCFTAGTLIRTQEGLKPIEKIEIGDLVLSLDPNTGEMSYKRVSRLFSKETPLIHRVTYTNGNVINTTWNHPFFIRGKGFTEVRNLQPEERSVTVASIRNSARIERSSGIQIGASLAALGSQSNNPNSATWKEEIRGTVGIAKIEEIYEKTKVYNFEVEDNHTYFVGKDGVLVHNDASCGPGYVAGLKEAIAANGGELLGGKTLEERKAETALLREQAPNKKEFDAFYETGKTHVEVGKEAALWYSGERVLQLGVKGLIRGTEMFLGTEAGIKVASKAKGWFGLSEPGSSILSKSTIDSIKAVGQGNRPDPSSYLSADYIKSHLNKFSDGVTKFSANIPEGQIGPPGGTFVMPKEVADSLIKQSGGNVSKLERLLGLEPGVLGKEPVRIDIVHPNNLRMPSGNELGANKQWVPGGYTSGGIPEATIDPALPGSYSINSIK